MVTIFWGRERRERRKKKRGEREERVDREERVTKVISKAIYKGINAHTELYIGKNTQNLKKCPAG